MSTIIFTRGLPASGKSTAAKAWVAEDPDHRLRVCLDDLREMIGPYDNFSKHRESIILDIQDDMIVRALDDAYDVIVDATHLHARTPKRISYMVNQQFTGREIEFEIMDFSWMDLDECDRRNQGRDREVPANVMFQMKAKLLQERARGMWTMDDL